MLLQWRFAGRRSLAAPISGRERELDHRRAPSSEAQKVSETIRVLAAFTSHTEIGAGGWLA
jgi:hypothetical protein